MLWTAWLWDTDGILLLRMPDDSRETELRDKVLLSLIIHAIMLNIYYDNKKLYNINEQTIALCISYSGHTKKVSYAIM